MIPFQRQSELTEIVQLLKASTPESARTILIEGAAGAGKSTLLDRMAEKGAESGFTILSAVSSPGDRDIPMGLINHLIGSSPNVEAHTPTIEAGISSHAGAAQKIWQGLAKASVFEPVICCVDDIHFSDTESLKCLQYITRRARGGRVVVILTSMLHDDPDLPVSNITTDFLRGSSVKRITLAPLPRAATNSMLQEELGSVSSALVDLAHQACGGNPLLLKALSEELRVSGPHTGLAHDRLVVGRLFRHAATVCMHRNGPMATDLARMVAILGDQATPELLGFSADWREQGLLALQNSGLLSGLSYRHPAIRDAVLDEMGARKRSELHRKAAVLLHSTGGLPATTVAEHILASVNASDEQEADFWRSTDWVEDVLWEAAESHLARGDIHEAVRMLNRATDICSDAPQRISTRLSLAKMVWGINPAEAERHLSLALEEFHEGGSLPDHAQQMAQLLSSQGRIAELIRLRGSAPSAFPSVTTFIDEHTRENNRTSPMYDTEAEKVEQFLSSTKLAESTLSPIGSAIMALMVVTPERARIWCLTMLEQAYTAQAPGWQALFHTLHADIQLRLGDLTGARDSALDALQTLPETRTTVFAFAPTGLLVRACMDLGHTDEAARYLRFSPYQPPQQSSYGLSFIRARGKFSIANRQYRAAIEDFLEIGRRMSEWGIDRPAVLPWRSDAAEAFLLGGHPQRAAQLIEEQLAMPDANTPWIRGVSLRIKALSGSSEGRREMLDQAVEDLRKSGDRIEVARAMRDLAAGLETEGNISKSAVIWRTAWRLATECGAVPLSSEILPSGGPVPVNPEDDPTETRISESERRVATLAAQGLTNREISDRLFITVSTVEQHLTRVYRKLNITRRQDLPVDFQLQPLEANALH